MNLANKLTVCRMVLVPLMVVALYLPIPHRDSIAAALFILGGITDILDGHIARKQKLVSPFGIIMDPIADKLINLAALLVLLERNVVPAWVVILIVGREIIIGGIRLYALSQQSNIMAASKLGKMKTLFQDVAIGMLLLQSDAPFFDTLYIADAVLAIALVFTVWSTIDYAMAAVRGLREKRI